MKLGTCFKHPDRLAVEEWKFCSDPDHDWKPICRECDLKLNKIALKFAYPKTWRELYKQYKRSSRERHFAKLRNRLAECERKISLAIKPAASSS